MGRTTEGFIYGMLGVAVFSGSLPATRLAVAGFDPVFLTVARASIAGLLAAGILLVCRQRLPRRADLASLLIVALGVVVGFPLLTALALQHLSAARAIVFIGMMPLVTALFAVLRAGERPHPAFWLFAGLGSLLVAAFALAQGEGGSSTGDLAMLLAVIACGLGYAEGGHLSRRLGGWQVISWALVISLPPMVLLTFLDWPDSFAQVGLSAWLGLVYVSLFSMLIGFFFWYRGLARGGIAAVGQLQLLQPFMGLTLAALILDERVTWPMLAVSLAVIACVAAARRHAS
ncbi:EamA-like transporter family protein [Arboricoccus pini]|uniref:EamA-like transporter family protein n=1 Tax=Arboricoccus pini TaxID=1963835 RepID=A0A212QXB6_9PROT|nr:DMT family transporter [Arboricoccus pini]SNB64377.1 EamA-like transporter family protein [Arboricoccus pini]